MAACRSDTTSAAVCRGPNGILDEGDVLPAGRADISFIAVLSFVCETLGEIRRVWRSLSPSGSAARPFGEAMRVFPCVSWNVF